ncbi:Cation/H+ exchanger, partial [Corchorus capsularis]
MSNTSAQNSTSQTQNISSNQQCLNFVASTMMNGSGKFLAVISAYILSRVVHQVLRPLSQPYITSDLLIGLFLGSLPPVRESFATQLILTLENIVDFGMICYLFVLGLEMDPYVVLKSPTRHAMVAYAGTLSTFIIACSVTPWLHYYNAKNAKIVTFTISLSVSLSGSGSHILTRLITSLKIGKSDIGKLGIGAGVHSDMITMFFLSIGFVFYPMGMGMGMGMGENQNPSLNHRAKEIVKMGAVLLFQTIVAAKFSPVFMNWVNNENPEGKPLKGSHLVLSMAYMALICAPAPFYGYNPFMSAFMAGLFLPSEGRISKWAISKINYLLSTVFYPLFFFWVGLKVNFKEFKAGDAGSWARFFVLLSITTVGKIAGTVMCGLMLGYHWPELVALALLLTAKGHFHIYFSIFALRKEHIDMTTCISMVIVVFLTIVHTPFVVKHIIERARKRVPIHRMALQWLDPSNELRILLCLHGTHNVPSAINLMEISRGPPQPGLSVFVTDMVELTDQIAATLVQGEGVDSVTVTDESVTEMRDQVTHAFQAYIDENGAGITLSRMIALSTFNGMAQDLSALGEDLMTSLILLPFHKRLNADGTLDGGHPGFRYVNRK